MVGGSIRLFRLGGIPVELHVSWVLILCLVTWTTAAGYYPENFPGIFTKLQLWILGFLTAILLFVSILLHEFSHSLVASRNGLPIRKITLFMFGGIAHMARDVENPVLELKMAAAGPAMSLVLAGIFYSSSVLFREAVFAAVLLQYLAIINIYVIVFNMVPGFPLDGGRILRAAIWYKTGNVRRATRITSSIGSGFAVFLMIFGFYISYKWSFVGGLWLVLIGFFLKTAARSSYIIVAFRQAVRNMRIADVMRTDFITVEASVKLSNLVDDYFKKYHLSSFPVVMDGRLIGIVSTKHLRQVEKERWADAIVEDIVDRRFVSYRTHPYEPAERLLPLVMRRGYDRAPVVDDEGRMVGIVTRNDLMVIIKLMNSTGQ